MPETGQHEAWSSPFEVDELLGQELGGAYRITRRIGAGGMGSVYEAKHLRLNRRVAVKVLNSDLVSDPTYMERFRREAEVTSKLKHKHIAEVLDFNALANGTPYMVMEYLEGEDLSLRIKKDGHLEPTALVPIIDGIANALAAAHKIGVLHRDIKPANIFLARLENHEIAKLLDFGAAKQKGSDSNLTAFGQVLGSIHYVSPEQARGQELDARTDLFSLGIVLYEGLTGHNPFEAATPNDTLFRIVGDKPTPFAKYDPQLSPQLEEVVHRALAKKREERYATVLEFAEAARAALDQGKRSKKKPMVIGAKAREDEPVLQGSIVTEEEGTHPVVPVPAPGLRALQLKLSALHEAGILNAESYREGFAFARLDGELVFDRLVETERVDERVLLRFWVGSSKSKYLTRDTLAKSKVPPEAKAQLSQALAEKLSALPVHFNASDQTLTVASADCSPERLERIRVETKVPRVQGIQALVGTVRAGIRKAYLGDAQAFARPEPRAPAPALPPPPPPQMTEPVRAVPPPPPPVETPLSIAAVEARPPRKVADEFDTLPPQRPLTVIDSTRQSDELSEDALPADASIRDPLTAARLITPEALEAALGFCRAHGGLLADALLRLDLVKEVDFLRTFAELYGVRFVKSDKVTKVAFAPEMLERFPVTVAETIRAMPFSQNPQTGETHVIAAVPLDAATAGAVQKHTGARSVTVYLATPGAVAAAIRRWYYSDTQIFSDVTPNGAGPRLAPRPTSGEVPDSGQATSVGEAPQGLAGGSDHTNTEAVVEEPATKTVQFSALDLPSGSLTPPPALSPLTVALDFQRRVELQGDRAAMARALLDGVLAVFPAVGAALIAEGHEPVTVGLREDLREAVPATIVSSALAAKAPYVIVDPSRDERFAHSALAHSGKLKSVVATALRGREKVLGTLVIDATVPVGSNELQVVSSLATLCATRLDDLERVDRLRARDRERWRHGRFLPPNRLADAYNNLIPGLRDDGIQVESTILYGKLRGIGSLVESMPPASVVTALNRLWTALAGTVIAHGGCMERVQGEAIMALWSTEVSGPDEAGAAIRCALALAAQAPSLVLDGRAPNLRVGIHSGPVVLGLIGTEARRDYAAIGPNVRLAAKLCGMALDGQVLCTQATLNRAPTHTGLKPIPLQAVEGFGATQMAYLIGAAEGEEISLDL